MVMNRCHFEYALTVCDFKISYLDNITHSFTNINNTDWKKNNRTFAKITESYNHSAEEQRTCITHKGFSRIPIPAKKTENSAQKCACKNIKACKTLNITYNNKRNCNSSCYTRAKSVNTVCKINRIDTAIYNKQR